MKIGHADIDSSAATVRSFRCGPPGGARGFIAAYTGNRHAGRGAAGYALEFDG